MFACMLVVHYILLITYMSSNALYTEYTNNEFYVLYSSVHQKRDVMGDAKSNSDILNFFFFRLVNKCCPNVDQMELLTNGMDWIRFTTDFVTLSRIFTENVFPRVLAQCTHAFKAKIAHVLT